MLSVLEEQARIVLRDSAWAAKKHADLLRDHLPASTVEEIVLNSTGPNTEKTNFCNGYLAKYAQDLADRLTTK